MKTLPVENQTSFLSYQLASLWNTFTNGAAKQSVQEKNTATKSLSKKAEQLGCDMSQFNLVS